MKSLCKVLAFTIAFIIKAESCEVGVSPLWERITYAPQDSTIQINCTANGSAHSPVWSILLSGTTAITQFSFPQSIRLLNSRGFYKIPLLEVTGTLKTIQLLINSTEGNNGTLIKCNDVVSSTSFSETNLIVFEPSPVFMDATDLHLQTVYISWSSLSQSIYTLTIINSSNTHDQPQILELNQPYYEFTAPEGAPPCEVYNFSVTATYAGATYTGADCSVPSPVLSRMLPSLPEIGPPSFTLEKKSIGITLITSFEIATYCDMYPVTNYTIEIKQFSSGSDIQSLNFSSATNHIIANDLLENELYKFRMTAWNSAGSVSSDDIEIYTTDVQKAVVTLRDLESGNFNVTCYFLTGSDALGCMVILIGQFSNHTMRLMKRSADIVHTEELKLENKSLSCYNRIVAFDIECDGSVGTLSVPGHLVPVSGHLERSRDGPCIESEGPPILITVGQSGSKRMIPHNAIKEVVLGLMISVYVILGLFNGS